MATGTSAPALPAIKRRVRGGVPVYVVDGPAPARCALMFRVGRADETLVNGGVTHLVEHLALFPLGDRPYPYNGFVEPHRTVFHAAGRPEECVEFLTSVTGSLADLPMHRLEYEHRVLGAEAAGRGSGVFDALVTYRFGPRGLGLVGYPQFGAPSMTAAKVDAWRAEWFTAGNAALVVSGVPLEALTLTLPPGAPRRPVAAPSVEPELPAWFWLPGAALGVSMVAERGPALSAGLRIVEKRLAKRLRTEMAIVYQVAVSAQYLDAHRLHVVIACDPVPEHASDALEAVRGELDRLATDGPDRGEVEADRSGLQREWEDANAGYAVADLMATDELLGAARRTPAAMVKAVRAVTADDVRHAFDRARCTALWAVPGDAAGPSGVRPVSVSSEWRAEGRRRAPAKRALDVHLPKERLIVGDDGVGIECGDDWHVGVPYDHCAAMLSWRDGARLVYGEDGFVVRIKPWEWVDGAKAVAEIDAHVDRALVVDLGDGEGPPAAADREDRPGRNQRGVRILAGIAVLVAVVVALALALATRG